MFQDPNMSSEFLLEWKTFGVGQKSVHEFTNIALSVSTQHFALAISIFFFLCCFPLPFSYCLFGSLPLKSRFLHCEGPGVFCVNAFLRVSVP